MSWTTGLVDELVVGPTGWPPVAIEGEGDDVEARPGTAELTLVGGILGDSDGVKPRPEVIELALVPVSGKHTMQCKQLNTLPLEVTTKDTVRWALTAVFTIHMTGFNLLGGGWGGEASPPNTQASPPKVFPIAI